MRISVDVLSMAEQRTNPLGERELVLRGLGIPAIENLASTRDLVDAIDLADNLLVRLDNFPKLLRLKSLYCSGNSIDSIDVSNLSKNLPNLSNLVLSENNISSLHTLANIAKACPNLEYLSLSNNSVTRKQHYRLYVIHKLPKLKVLDFMKIKQAERDRARRLAMSSAGAALEGDVRLEASKQKQKQNTFVPGGDDSKKIITHFTAEQKAKIREMIANATSPAEIERIESSVKKGIFPAIATTNGTATTTKRVIDTENDDGDSTKRSRST